MCERKHWIMFAFWGYSHFKPTVEFAQKLMREQEVDITFLIETHSKIANLITEAQKPNQQGQKIDFYLLPESSGDDVIDPSEKHDLYLQSLVKYAPAAVLEINASRKIERAIFEMYGAFAFDAIVPLNIPHDSFFTVNGFAIAYMLAVHFHKDRLELSDLKKLQIAKESIATAGQLDSISTDMALTHTLNIEFRGGPPSEPSPNIRHFYLLEEYRTMSEVIKSSQKVYVNSFKEFETFDFDYLRNLTSKFEYVGPVNLSTVQNQGDINLLQWLQCQPPNSVLYIAFGQEFTVKNEEIEQISIALDDSGIPCIWAVGESQQQFIKQFTKNKNVKVVSWAPQQAILNSKSIGVFMSHCGWNSVLEGLSAGVPFIAWPIFAEQYLNAILLAEKGLATLIPQTGLKSQTIIKHNVVYGKLRYIFDNIASFSSRSSQYRSFIQ